MDSHVERVFNLEDFISHIICDQLKRLIYTSDISPYSKFLTLPQYIEFLGACIDEHEFIDETKSKSRFNNVLTKYFKPINNKYILYNDTHLKWNLYKDFRCGVVHQLRPLNKIAFTTRDEAKESGNKHLEIDEKHDEYLVLVLEDMYDHIEKVANNIINDHKNKKFKENVNIKWTIGHISVINNGEE